MPDPHPCRIAVIGLGKIATDQHLPAIAANPAYQLVAVVTPQPLAAPPPCPVLPDHHALLAAGPPVDAVAICTPPNARHRIACDMLAAGVDVLLEKPTTATLAEAEDIAAAARRTGRVAYATWHSRHSHSVRQAREFLDANPPTRLHIDWKEDVRKWHPGQDWIWRPGGFGVFDPGINALSILTAILPAPVFVRAAELLVRPGEDTPVAAELEFEGPGGLPITASFDWRPNPDIRVITADTARGRMALSGRTLTLDGAVLSPQDNAEYAEIYARFAHLRAAGQSDADLAPLRLVADSFLLGRRTTLPG